MSVSNEDRNVMFGVLAVEKSFVGREVLVQSMGTWVQDKSKSLGQILLERQVLSSQSRDLLETLTDERLQQSETETEKSLATVGWTESLQEDLRKIARSEWHRTPSDAAPSTVTDSSANSKAVTVTADSSPRIDDRFS